jgi:hypothetical protein
VVQEPTLPPRANQAVAKPSPADTANPPVSAPVIDLPLVGELKFTFPGGPVDCEALAYDSRRQTFVLASKELWRTRLFELDAAPLDLAETRSAKLVGSLMIPMVTGSDISRDGEKLVLSTYGPGCVLRKKTGGTWETQADSVHFFELPSRKQGESVCFEEDGRKILLTSEFAPTPLYRVEIHERP